MSKTAEAVTKSILAGKPNHGRDSCYTNGRCVYSYGEVIVAPDPLFPEGFVTTTKKWSRTTSKQQNAVVSDLRATGKAVRNVSQREVDDAADCGKGCSTPIR
jgi:hypothetical protein